MVDFLGAFGWCNRKEVPRTVTPTKAGVYKGVKSNGSGGLSWTRSMKKIAGVKVRDNVRLLTFSS
jgi:hypothetical protein